MAALPGSFALGVSGPHTPAQVCLTPESGEGRQYHKVGLFWEGGVTTLPVRLISMMLSAIPMDGTK